MTYKKQVCFSWNDVLILAIILVCQTINDLFVGMLYGII